MNQEVKREWIAALQSGEFKQGKKFLRRGDLFCCLGVLCEIYRRRAVMMEVSWDSEDRFVIGEHSHDGVLPSLVMIWAGLDDRNPVVTFKGKDKKLAELNDSGVSFDGLATIIEIQL